MFRAALPVSPFPSNPSVLPDGDRLVVALSTRSLVAAVIVVVWVGSGLVTAVVMARRGHELKTLAPLGVVVGPFLAGLAWSNYVAREAEIEPVVLAAGVPGPGSKSLLVAVLGDPDDAVLVAPLLRSMEDDLGEVVLVRTVPFEAAQDPAWDRTKGDAATELTEAARLLPGIEPQLLLVPGRAEAAITRHVIDHAITHVVCVGSRPIHDRLCDDEALSANGVIVLDPEADGDGAGRA